MMASSETSALLLGAGGLRMSIQYGQQCPAEERTAAAGRRSADLLIAAQRRLIELERPASGALD